MDSKTTGPEDAPPVREAARSRQWADGAGVVIALLQDGRPGHENQAMALIEALQRRLPVAVHPIAVPAGHAGPARLYNAWVQARRLPRTDLLVGAGHSTHGALLLLSTLRRVPSLVLMRPSLPMGWFSRVVVPAHDVSHKARGRQSARVIETLGPLCRQPTATPASAPASTAWAPSTLVLIGGPSKHHHWDPACLQRNLATLLAADADSSGWCLVASRRTPAGSVEQLARALHLRPEQQMPWHQCPEGWLAMALARRPRVWVTEDSMSMLFEAVTAGARVGVLPMPSRRRSRLQAALDRLVVDGYVLPLSTWRPGRSLPPPARELREADRVADLLLPWLRTISTGRAAPTVGP